MTIDWTKPICIAATDWQDELPAEVVEGPDARGLYKVQVKAWHKLYRNETGEGPTWWWFEPDGKWHGDEKSECIRVINLTSTDRQQPAPIIMRDIQSLGRAIRPTTDQQQPISAKDQQVGGSHYTTMKIQPLEYCMANEMDACQTKVIKYVSRKKGDKTKRLEDLDKAIHVLNYYKEWIEQNA